MFVTFKQLNPVSCPPVEGDSASNIVDCAKVVNINDNNGFKDKMHVLKKPYIR